MLGQSLYDSTLWNRKQKPNHRYAMQLVLKSSMQTVSRLFQRTKTNYALKEDWKFGCLGNPTEPLLSTAIGKITGTGKMLKQSPTKN
jgi:hypothetical protein